MKKLILVLAGIAAFSLSYSQSKQERAKRWADSVMQTLNNDQRIAQLMIIRAHSNLGAAHVKQVTDLIQKYNVGGLCFFQGGPVRQANLTNFYQSIAKTPLMITIDGEWGLGMRLDSVVSLPRQLMLGAVQDAAIAYDYGKILGEQCKRMGIQVNFAPVVDVNNNPNNPVINDRSFGEDRYKVALFGVQVMKGMQDMGVMACAKHFPGHGDTETDSHYDLPIINKTKQQLDSLELYPFREIFENGVGSVMIGHLYIPAIDNTKNQATSLSYNNVTKLLRDELGYKGLTFTDALEMQGVKKFYPDGAASVQSLIAGNDLLCLPSDIPAAIKKIKAAVKKKKLSWDDLNSRVHRVLMAKYLYGLGEVKPIDTNNLVNDLNGSTEAIRKLIAQRSVTLARNDQNLLPLSSAALSFMGKATNTEKKIAYIAIGTTAANVITQKMKDELKADIFFFSYKSDAGRILSLVELIKQNYSHVVIGMHGYSRRPQNNFGISASALQLAKSLAELPQSALILFGNPYALKNFCDVKTSVICYEDDAHTQAAAFDVLIGKQRPTGKLPVTVCDNIKYGTGLEYMMPAIGDLQRNLLPETRFATVDSIVADAIQKKAMPGCVVMAVKDGKIMFEKAYGYYTYEQQEPMTLESVFDMASVTKICATTISVMKLYEEGKIDLKKRLGDYIPWVNGTNKQDLLIEDILLHQAGLKSWIPFYKETIDTNSGIPSAQLYTNGPSEDYNIRVADTFYMRNDWRDTMYQRILQSEMGPYGKYVYSDNDFIFLGKVVEQLTGMTLDEYVRKTFYEPLHLESSGFLPLQRMPVNRIVPTEREVQFRRQLLRGDVHDPGAAMFGGIAGHAGLFSTAYELAVILQMLNNGGTIGQQTFFKPETVQKFIAYGSETSRRGLGFDKPEKDNLTRKDPYPALSVSPSTFGHTGYTGTGVWADPENKIVYIFLSNRVHPEGGTNTKLLTMNVRGKIQDALYKVLLEK
ncbi:glycoside hydrolase family 3 N-terminal domain-containing protein [Lacibacter sediminis]|uniref:beta-N-acetylhexosaminidase n=1 Tax=Lacibacter sediminis TaxID=2760713 RepID=A0A7G5XG50_9BACT|nr:glycoside hydrolase family 3 N-terminal domain-containing protein [Lacibacter sediminis]QNA44453.1 serine hydrolase [Lacibacter sediminis]